MSWRVALFLIIGIPFLLALGNALVAGMSFAMFSYPLAMLSVWQHGRRISRHAFAAATDAPTPDTDRHQQLVGIARIMEGGGEERSTVSKSTSDFRYIGQTAYDAGLQAKRLRPTFIEGFALAAAALMIISIGLGILLPVASKREAASRPSPTESAEIPERTPATKLAAKFSTRTEAAIALWNKTYPIPASNELRVAMQTFEDSNRAFLQASGAVDAEAVCQDLSENRRLLAGLEAYKRASLDMLTAIRAYREQVRVELRRAALPDEEQRQIFQKNTEGYRRFDEWGAAAVQAADAGLTVRSLIEHGLPSDSAKQHFIEAWNASYAIQQSMFDAVQKAHTRSDELLRK